MTQKPRRRASRPPKKVKAMTGPKSLFRGKVRKPLTLLLTPNGMEKETTVREETHLSRGDLYEYMLLKYGDDVIEEMRPAS